MKKEYPPLIGYATHSASQGGHTLQGRGRSPLKSILALFVLILTFSPLFFSCSTISGNPENVGTVAYIAYEESKGQIDQGQSEAIELAYSTLCEILDNRHDYEDLKISAVTRIAANVAEAKGVPPAITAISQQVIKNMYWQLHQKYGLNADDTDNMYRILEQFRQGVEQARKSYGLSLGEGGSGKLAGYRFFTARRWVATLAGFGTESHIKGLRPHPPRKVCLL